MGIAPTREFMTIQIGSPEPESLRGALDQVVSVYRAVFTLPPWDETEEDVAAFGERFTEHLQRAGLRCVTAVDADADRIVGFAYGFTGPAGELWYDLAARALGPAEGEQWLSDCFEFVELALVPAMRGQGIGGRLHDALLTGLPHPTAVLSTIREDMPALHLYQRRGWVDLSADLRFYEAGRPYMVLGLELQPATAAMCIPLANKGTAR
jgi:GNAT superfamily N-acetyltransferase